MPRRALLLLLLPALLAACDKLEFPGRNKKDAKPPPVTLLLTAEDLRQVGFSDRAQGPVITGSVQPERRADLRAVEDCPRPLQPLAELPRVVFDRDRVLIRDEVETVILGLQINPAIKRP